MSKFSAVVLFCAFLGIVQALPQGRIVGGSDATEGQFPYQISLWQDGRHICGGSIISANFILTAAHCVGNTDKGAYEPTDPEELSVLAGTNNLLKGGERHRVASVKVHENYTKISDDVALLALEKPLVFSNAIQAVPLAGGETPDGSSVVISGWGRLDTDGDIPNRMQWNVLSSISKDECFESIGLLTDTVICLAHEKNNGACMGDSGGPAVFNGELVGVAGFVVDRCGSGNPDGYAKVFHHLDWIQSNTDLEI